MVALCEGRRALSGAFIVDLIRAAFVWSSTGNTREHDYT
jgi:hypothetical protein